MVYIYGYQYDDGCKPVAVFDDLNLLMDFIIENKSDCYIYDFMINREMKSATPDYVILYRFIRNLYEEGNDKFVVITDKNNIFIRDEFIDNNNFSHASASEGFLKSLRDACAPEGCVQNCVQTLD